MKRLTQAVLLFVLSTSASWLALFFVFIGDTKLLTRYLDWTFNGGGERVMYLALAALFCGALITMTSTIVLLTRRK